MKKTLFFKVLFSFFFFSHPLYSVVPDPVPCVMNLEVSFFPESIVSEALSLYLIPQGLWPPISTELQQRSQTVPERMKLKTARMVPNPIEYPMKKFATAKILKGVLYEVFMEAMRIYEVNEQPNADLIFNFILKRQGLRFVECFGPEANTLIPK